MGGALVARSSSCACLRSDPAIPLPGRVAGDQGVRACPPSRECRASQLPAARLPSPAAMVRRLQGESAGGSITAAPRCTRPRPSSRRRRHRTGQTAGGGGGRAAPAAGLCAAPALLPSPDTLPCFQPATTDPRQPARDRPHARAGAAGILGCRCWRTRSATTVLRCPVPCDVEAAHLQRAQAPN